MDLKSSNLFHVKTQLDFSVESVVSLTIFNFDKNLMTIVIFRPKSVQLKKTRFFLTPKIVSISIQNMLH